MAAPEWLYELDRHAFVDCFNRSAFRIRHRLEGHELFTLPRLTALANFLPESNLEYSPGNVPADQDPTLTPRNGLSVDETIRRIEECQSWMALKNVELDREYAALLDSCIDQILVYSNAVSHGATRREAYIFVSSPNAVTPFHFDNEYNFLLQIRGKKRLYQWDRADRSVVSERQLEAFYVGAHRNLPFRDELMTKAVGYDLCPGDGLHVPIAAPHWVKNGPSVSVSFSVTFRNEDSERLASAYCVNSRLRKLGIEPLPPGRSKWRDELKHDFYRIARRARLY
jgi:hypothetical protein